MKINKDAFVQKIAHKDDLVAWLLHSGSFMRRLADHGVDNAQIQVLKEGWGLPSLQEQRMLQLPFRTFVWMREVVIQSSDTIWMFARTVIPRVTLSGKERELQHLKTRSLGSVLFRYPDLERSEFDYFILGAEKKLEREVAKYVTIPDEGLWSRRSVFTLQKKSVLLTEVFFPEVRELSVV
jgi:chorismate lyase